MIVLQGLRGKAIADLCSEHQISQAQYYQWRDHFWPIPTASLTNTPTKKFRLQEENARLKHMIGELTMELKKRNRAQELGL
ncbi:MAG: transposase [Elusimicrobia bacterium]|nr:transposase [Elusimicrobiota bacterium]